MIYDHDNGGRAISAAGTCKQKAHIVAVLDDAPVLAHTDSFAI